MKRFFAELFAFLLFVGLLILGIAIVWAIAESDLPFWVKFWLLRG
jgi:hypothetical protein